jgi:hypothetical protein
VRDESGQPVADAVATVRDAATGTLVVAGASKANGCLDLFEPVESAQRAFALRIEAPGYRAGVLSFSRREKLTLLVTLTAESGASESTVRRIPLDDQATTYDLYCASFVPPAAEMLGVR